MPALLDDFYARVAPFRNARRWLVAYSGGVDSHVLLHLLVHCPGRPPVMAVHVNHQLQSAADQWVVHCRQQADALGVPFSCISIDVHRAAGAGMEAKAREARYQAFESQLEPGDVLMLAHHRDDQAETLLLRLLRGSGSRGAAAMPGTRPIGPGILARPLLNIPQSDIEAYAHTHDLPWIEDPSNQNSDIDRNFLRLEILPRLAQRWPQYRQTLFRAAALNEEAAQLNADLAALDFQARGLSAETISIPLSAVTTLGVARQKNLLRYWLQRRGLPLPSAAQLQAVIDDVINARPDGNPLVEWPGVQMRRFKQQLYAVPPVPAFDSSAEYDWDMTQPLAIKDSGTVYAQPVTGAGLAVSRLTREQVTVRFRRGGERCRPQGRGASQMLKKLFQEYEVATWLRDRWPLIYCGEELVAAADLWVCEGFQAAAEEPGLAVRWSSCFGPAPMVRS